MTTLRQLEYFVAIIDEGSFTRAAASLNVTQPGLSHQFQALERELGTQLVERLGRGVRLTSAGRAMLPSARAALTQVRRATAAARRAAGLTSGELQIATLYSISYGVLPRVLAAWRARHPDMRVTLFEHEHKAALAEAMEQGQADVAIGPAPSGWRGTVRHLGSEEFVILTTSGDPLASRSARPVRLSTLADRDWVHFTPASGLADILDNACAAAGFQPRIALRTQQAAFAANYAAAGMGLTLIPENNAPENFSGALLRPAPAIKRNLTAFTHGIPDAVTGTFLDLAAEQCGLAPTRPSEPNEAL
ncbi:LysR family transcriptional regulator [Streptomyces sp. gb14]|uniref:LysR family transcriptional regulator n=1 Tax=Streptomyces sp. gb14 TaxID=1827753 RepID=UPI000BF0E1FD|nr:LysR family transcriptional regulator [Streptomyces sp. gb14]